MKQLFTLAFALALPAMAFAQGKQVPYSSTFYQDAEWTVINVAEGTKTWEDIEFRTSDAKEAGYPNGKEYRYDRKNPADDWLIGPAIHLEAGKEYKVIFMQEVDANERFSLHMAQSGTMEALSAEGAMIYDFQFSDYGWQRISKVVSPAVTADYVFGFHAYSPEYEDDIVITGFEVKENIFSPASPGNLTVTPDINGLVVASLSWTLPTSDSDGAELPQGATFDKVEVFRDGVLIGTLAGDATSFTDTESLGLTAGKHLYGVSVTVNGVASARTETQSRHIGPLQAFSLPWTAGIQELSADDFATYFTIVKGPNSQLSSSKGWSLKSGYIQFYPSSYDREDDWLMLPKVKFDEPGVYRLRMDAEYNETASPGIEVYKGTGRSIESQTAKLGVIESLPATRGESYVAFKVDEAGEFNLSLHAAREEGPSGRYMKFYEFIIEKTIERPAAISDLKVAAIDNSAQITMTAPAVTNIGSPIDAISKIEIYRDGQLLTTITENIVPGNEVSYSDTPENGGVFKYHAVPYVGDVAPDTEPIAVTSPWIGDKTQAIPYEVDFTQDVDTSILSALWEIRNGDGDEDDYWGIGTNAFTLTLNDYDGGTADDMLVSPPFNLEYGKYEVLLNLKGAESEFPLVVGFIMDGSDMVSYPQTLALDGRNKYSDYNATIEVLNESGVSPQSEQATPLRGRLAIHANGEYGYDLYNLMIRKVSLSKADSTVGIDEVTGDNASDCRFYNLQGLEITNPRKGDIYIIRRSNGQVVKAVR